MLVIVCGVFIVWNTSLYWTERHLVNATFLCFGNCLRDIWHLGRFIILGTEVCLLYRTLHCIRQPAI